MIRNASLADAPAIAGIYNHYVLNTVVTFEEESVSAEQMRERLMQVQASYPWLVYEDGGSVIGYAYAAKWSARCSYRHSVETTIYLDKDRLGEGIGSLLYSELLNLLKSAGFNTAIGGIALPNDGS